MELIYFWVDGYKNLFDCGVQLSPNYDVERQYNADTENLHIDIKKSKNSTNIFKDKKLNITTIVGANGSGKSNILDALSIVLTNQREKKFKYCLFFEEKEGISYLSSSDFIFKNYKQIEDGALLSDRIVKFKPFNGKKSALDFSYKKILRNKEKDFFYYNEFNTDETAYTMSILLNKANNCVIFNESNSPELKFDKFRWEIDIESKRKEFKFKFESYWDLDGFFGDTNIKTYLKEHTNKIKEIFSSFGFKVGDSLTFPAQKNIIDKFKDIACYAAACEYIEFLNEVMSEKIYGPSSEKYVSDCLNSLLVSNNMNREKIIKRISDSLVKPYKQRLSKKYPIYDETKDYIEKIVTLIENSEKTNDFLKDFKESFQDNLVYKKDFSIKNYHSNKFSDYYPNNNNFLPDKLLNELVMINFYKQNKNNPLNKLYSFNELSTGEQRILKFFADLYYIEEATSTRQAKTIYLLDEMDLSWHPEWQRKMIYYLVDTLSKINTRTFKNIIIATHSPFVLSDMPKANVQIIQKDVGTGNARISKPTKNTFGSNIHDLFKESFFLSSTVGEFAKSEIEKVIEKINNLDNKKTNNTDLKEIQNFIEQIGEPIIKMQLQKLLSTHYPESESDSIEQLQKQISLLKQENNQLKGKLNNNEKN